MLRVGKTKAAGTSIPTCTSCRSVLDLCWKFIIFHLYSILSSPPLFFLNTAMIRIYTSACIQLYLVIVGGAPTSLGLQALSVPTDVPVCNHTGPSGDCMGLLTHSTQKLRFESVLKGWIPGWILCLGCQIWSSLSSRNEWFSSCLWKPENNRQFVFHI